jgi:hypothetical protein
LGDRDRLARSGWRPAGQSWNADVFGRRPKTASETLALTEIHLISSR